MEVDPALKLAVRKAVQAQLPFDVAIKSFRELYVAEALEVSRNNRCKAGRLIGAHRNTINRHVPQDKKKLGPHKRLMAVVVAHKKPVVPASVFGFSDVSKLK